MNKISKNICCFFIIFSMVFCDYVYSNECETVSVGDTNFTVVSSGTHTSINEDPYGLGCLSAKETLEILGGLIVVFGIVSLFIDDGESEEVTAFSAYSSSKEFGFQFNKLPDNYFLRLTSPKTIDSNLEEGINSLEFNQDKPARIKLAFGLKF